MKIDISQSDGRMFPSISNSLLGTISNNNIFLMLTASIQSVPSVFYFLCYVAAACFAAIMMMMLL
jgi:hypothetical protein